MWILSAVLTVSFVFDLSHFLSFEQFVLPKSRAYCNTHFFVLILHKFCLLGKITKALHSTSAFVWTYFWTLRPVAEFWKNIRDKHSSSYGEKDLGAAVIKNRWFVGMGYKLVLVKLGDILETFYMVGFCGRKRNGRLESRQNANHGHGLSRWYSVHISLCSQSYSCYTLCCVFLCHFLEMVMASFIFNWGGNEKFPWNSLFNGVFMGFFSAVFCSLSFLLSSDSSSPPSWKIRIEVCFPVFSLTALTLSFLLWDTCWRHCWFVHH